MPTITSFSDIHLVALSKLLGECGTGTDLDQIFRSTGLEDRSGESTKWKRISWVLTESQRIYHCGNKVLDFIKTLLNPVRFVNQVDRFEAHRQDLNQILSFCAIEYGSDGNFRTGTPARTLDEAEKRVRTLRSKFQGRSIHPEVIKYCRAELLQDNYFHAVFEASKGLAERIREKSGLTTDGAFLVDTAFSVNQPLLAFNTLKTETEQTEHKGFASLLKGCFAAVRNPLAHEPRILWDGEEDAADYLSLISLLHRKLDVCISTGLGAKK